MTFAIGTDEAGYGPNLGPLVVSATLWRLPDRARVEDLYELLDEAVVAGRVRRGGRALVPMADSKALYSPGSGLGNLDRGLLAALAVLGRRPRRWSDAWRALAPEAMGELERVPWYAGFERPVPVDATADEVDAAAELLRRALAARGVELLDARSRVLLPGEFNRLVDQHGSKGSVLSHVTLQLAADLARPIDEGPISIVCDKHGGRSRYGPLVEEHFPDWLVEIHGEGRQRSVYRLGPAGRRVEIRFQTKAESCLPVALASMASKYLRELAMAAFNAFWLDRVKGLRPTAGYPQDAKRFRAEIADAQKALGIDDAVLWRER